MDKQQFIKRAEEAIRGSADDLRAKGLLVSVHYDYWEDTRRRGTFWQMKVELRGVLRAFEGRGETDAEALDQIRARYAAAIDDHHHAPMCPANHMHGQRAPIGPCSCGAVEMGAKMNCGLK